MRFASIQALRAVAAIAVLIYHSGGIFKHISPTDLIYVPLLSDWGSLGLRLFFCISGFIIAHVLTQGTDISTYFRRRFWRIYPAYTVSNLVILALWYWQNLYHADVAALGVSGIVKSFLIVPQEPFPLNNPGWTLENEIIFYVLAGLVAPLAGYWSLFGLLVFLGFCSLLFTGWNYDLFSTVNFFFAAGIVAYKAKDAPLRFTMPFVALTTIIGLETLYGWFGALEALPLHLHSLMRTRLCLDLILASWMLGIVMACVSLEREGFHFPRLLVSLGSVSYSIYVFHVIVLASVMVFAARASIDPAYVETLRWGAVAASIGVAYLSFWLVERPFIRWSHRDAQRPAPVLTPAQ